MGFELPQQLRPRTQLEKASQPPGCAAPYERCRHSIALLQPCVVQAVEHRVVPVHAAGMALIAVKEMLCL